MQDFKPDELHGQVRWKGYGANDDTLEPPSCFEKDPLTYPWASKAKLAQARSRLQTM